MKAIINVLNKEYPVVESNQKSLQISILVGLFTFLFLYTFQPFQLDTIPGNKALTLSGYGIICFLLIFIGITIQRGLAQKVKWKTWKQILFYLILISSIAISNFLYSKSYNPDLKIPLAEFLYYTFSIAIFPLSFYVVGTQRRLESKHLKESKLINQRLIELNDHKSIPKANFLNIESTEKENLSIDQSQILYLESIGNYLHIYHLEGRKINPLKTRGTIKDILPQLDTKSFQKTHRAFIVNINHVLESSGNAQGLRLKLNSEGLEVPVSRNHVKTIKSSLHHSI